MKRQSKYIWAVAAGIVLLATPSTGAQQDAGACFFLDESGQRIDLGNLCGQGGNRQSGFKARIKRRRNGIPVIDVTFNGRHTVEMLLDTGASGVAISPSIARQIEFRAESVGQSQTAGGLAPILIGRVESISVAGITTQDHVVSVAPALDMVGLGLLGQSFYGDFDIIIRQDIVEFRRR